MKTCQNSLCWKYISISAVPAASLSFQALRMEMSVNENIPSEDALHHAARIKWHLSTTRDILYRPAPAIERKHCLPVADKFRKHTKLQFLYYLDIPVMKAA
jgi:hypothetical protein